MKKFFTGIVVILTIFVSACDKYDDGLLMNRVDDLEKRLSAMETVMNAYENKLFIESVEEIANGYIITFSDGSKATITNDVVGNPGEDGDTLIDSIIVSENEVTFNLTNGQSFTIPLHSALSITFDSEDLVVMQTNSTRDVRYTIQSFIPDIDIEAVSSADIKAKAVPDDENSLSGYIKITTGSMIDEYSKVVVFVSNGERVIMKSLSFEETGIEVIDNAVKSCGIEGGEVMLEFMSNVECKAVISEEANDWISVVSPTRAFEYNAITLKLEPNTEYTRSAVVPVQSIDGSVRVEYIISQTGELGVDINPDKIPNNEIWYVTENNSTIPLQDSHYDATVISHTSENGLCKIVFNKEITSITGEMFDLNTFIKLNRIYLPKSITHITSNPIYGYQYYLTEFGGPLASDDGKCLIVDDVLVAFASCGMETYSIPENVTTIGSWAFYNCSLTNIVIPDGVTAILSSAFRESSSLENISWPNSLLSIEDFAFYKTGLVDLLLPSSLTSIGEDSFGACHSLERVTLPENLTYIHGYAFMSCPNIKAFYGKYASDDNAFLSDGEYMFSYANGTERTSYSIPEGISIVENYTFLNNKSIQQITFPSSLKRLGGCAFQGCENLEYIYGDCASADHKCAILDGVLQLFASKGIKEFTTPDEATIIGSSVFSYNNELVKLILSDRVKKVGVNVAFNNRDAFIEHSPNLKTIVLSAGLTEFGYGFFHDCASLETVYCKAPIPPAAEIHVSDMTPHPIIYVPDESIELYQSSSYWKDLVDLFEPYDYGDLSEFYPDYYVSSDYSQDGIVETMQASSAGNGINIVLMGDGYSDRQIADGTYSADMDFVYRNLFTEEPYKSYRKLFDVSYVNVVSATEGYKYGNTALECQFGSGTYVYGNDSKCFEYALNAVSEKEMDETLIIVVMNSNAYAGTCFMYYPTNIMTDYGSGVSVAYFPKGQDEETFAQLLHHEACGHGFSKLADEYAYESMGKIPESEITATISQQNDWGWWKNVDFTNDPSTIRWSYFLADLRYAYDGLGAYEGGLTYWNGVWRPTENSIMRYNTGGFNAPSRESIYYRIHKLAYGDSWQYDYEDFVAYDAVNREVEVGAYSGGVSYSCGEPLHPPVVIKKSWRDAL